MTMTEDNLRGLCRKRSRESLVFFTERHDPAYEAGKVHHLVGRALERVARGEITRLIINMPPRHGKTRQASVEFPAWLLGHAPKKQIVNAGYAVDLALDSSKACRDIMRGPAYAETFGTRLNPKDQSAASWRTLAGGGYLAVGVEGALTGRGADVLIVDDPIKDPAEAASPAVRDAIWKWYLGVALTRLSPKGAIIIIQTRWHVDDLTGRLLDPRRLEEIKAAGGSVEPWTVINLPALAEAEDPMGRRPGEALWPERWPADHLRGIRSQMLPFLWNALYRGVPEVEGGNYVDASRLKIISPSDVSKACKFCRFWDLATSGKTKNDFYASAAVGIMPDGRPVLDAMFNEKINWPTAKDLIVKLGRNERFPIGVEAVGGFANSVADLRQAAPDLYIRGISVVDDKFTRALPWLARVAAGEFLCVAGGWIPEFVQQLKAFPSGAHDDMIDAVSGGFQMALAVHNAGNVSSVPQQQDRAAILLGTRIGRGIGRGRLLM